MTALATCRKRKYKKPLLKKCLALHLPVQESMTIDELMDYVTTEIKREFTKKTGETQFKLLLKNPIYEPVRDSTVGTRRSKFTGFNKSQ